MNTYWAKYGCDKCNYYKLLVLDVSITDSDTKQATQQYITQHGTKCPCVCAAEGGTTFFTALKQVFGGSPVGAGLTYLIKTDKTVKDSPTATEINNAGGNVQHVCQTGIKTDVHHSIVPDITIAYVKAGLMHISVYEADMYHIKACTPSGRVVAQTSIQLANGGNIITLNNTLQSSGVLVVSLNSEKIAVTQRVVLEK